jgi:antitoxin component YwqK of YwqJK toxin-antitoxin module
MKKSPYFAIVWSTLLIASSTTFGQITSPRTPPPGEGATSPTTNPTATKPTPKGERPVNCNEDLELDPGNHLIYHKKTHKPYTGLCISYHHNGVLERKVRFNEGKETDTSYQFYPSGRLEVKMINIDGVENGTWVYHYDNESHQLAWSNTYTLGKKSGTWSFYQEDGTKIKVLNYQNDQLHGVCSYYDKKGQIQKKIDYKNGLFDGVYLTYFADSVLKMNKLYKAGKAHGKFSYYFASGALSYEGEYKDDLRIGKWTHFHENGQVKKTGIFKSDKEDGMWEEFHEDGKNAKTTLYDKGSVLVVVEYDRFGKPKNDQDLVALNNAISKKKSDDAKAKKKNKNKDEDEDDNKKKKK